MKKNIYLFINYLILKNTLFTYTFILLRIIIYYLKKIGPYFLKPLFVYRYIRKVLLFSFGTWQICLVFYHLIFNINIKFVGTLHILSTFETITYLCLLLFLYSIEILHLVKPLVNFYIFFYYVPY